MKFNCAWVRLVGSIDLAKKEIDQRIVGIGWLETPTDTLLIMPAYSESQLATSAQPKHGMAAVRVYCWNTPHGRKDMVEDVKEMTDVLAMPITKV